MLNMVFSICGCYLLWFLSKRISQRIPFASMAEFIGINSLLLFAYHRPVLNFVIAPVLKRVVPGENPILYSLMAFMLLIGGYLAMLPFVKKFVPEALGMARSKNR